MDSEEQAASNQPSSSNPINVDEQGQPINTGQYNVQGDIIIKQYYGPPPVDVNALAEELRNKLIVRANEVVGETLLPIQLDREITRVKLQISTVIRHHIFYGDDFDWNEEVKRQPFSVLHKPDIQRIAINQIFDKAKETATRAATRFATDKAKAEYIKRHGNTIALTGLPGVGKSTTSKMITQSILDKTILPETEYLFYISIKNVNFKKQVTPFQFLTDNSLINWLHCDKENKELINELHNNPNVVIVMDSLDEAAANFYETPRNCPLHRKSKPVDIIKNLLNGTLLPNAVKLVTSRPGQFYQMHPDCRPTFVLEVLGLDQDAIDQLGTQICGERYPEIKKFLKERPNLFALCYVPVICILIMACLLICLSTGKSINSMTEVLIYALTHYMTSEHLKSDMLEEQIILELVKLSQLAFNGFKKQKLVFNINDFNKVNINKTMANNFMHTYFDKASGMRIKMLEGHKRSYFSHLMWQEFLSAIHMMLFMPYEQFQRYDFIFKEFQWENVTKFLFGLCNPTSYTDLKLIFPTSEFKDAWKKKKRLLDMISNQTLDSANPGFNKKLGLVSGWMQELGDKEVFKNIENSLPTNIEMTVPRNYVEVHNLVFVFKSCCAPHNLMVKAVDSSETVVFLRGLQAQPHVRIKKLELRGTDMRDITEYLLFHIQHIDDLQLWNCKHLSDFMSDIIEAITKRPNMIKLSVIADIFNDNAMQLLASCLGNISELNVQCNELSEKSRTIIKQEVKYLPHPTDLKITDQSIFFACSMQTTTAPTTESLIQTSTKPTTESLVSTTTKPTTESLVPTTTESLVQTITKPTTESLVPTITKPTTKSFVPTTTKPTTESVVQTTTKPTTESLVPTTTKPTTESVVQTTTKPTTESVVQTTTKPTTESLVLTTTKPTTESVVQTTTKPTTESLVSITTKPTTESLVPTTTKPTTELMTTNTKLFVSTTKTIGPKGGTIEVGGCALIVPAGALNEDVTIKLSLLHEQKKQSLVTQSIQCEPLLEIQQPVTLKLKALKPDVTLLKDYKIQWSNDGEGWDILREPELHLIDQSFEFQLHRLYPFIAIKEEENTDTLEVHSLIYWHCATNANAVVWKLNYHDEPNKAKLGYDEISRKSLVIPIRDIRLTIKAKTTDEVVVEPPDFLIQRNQLNKNLSIDEMFWVLPEKREIFVKAVLAAGDDIYEDTPFLLRKLKQQESDKPVTVIANSTFNKAAVQSDHVTISK